MDIHRIVFSNNAAGFAVLNENELELGSIVVDIGARTTSIGMFIKNKFIFSNALSFGGSDITEAIARKLSITYEEAEKLKVLYASVIDASQEEDIPYEVPSINFEIIVVDHDSNETDRSQIKKQLNNSNFKNLFISLNLNEFKNKNRSKYTFRDDKRNLEKKKTFSFLKQWVGDNFF